MTFTEKELTVILEDTTKRVVGDLEWKEDEDHSPAVEFQAEVCNAGGYPLFVKGSFNPAVGAVSFGLILQTTGRIYALDLGKDHHNPTCQRVGETHKHRWSDQFRDKQAYVPDDITVGPDAPLEAWEQFCAEAAIRHEGRLTVPPPWQEELF